jgi:hypothetical protein
MKKEEMRNPFQKWMDCNLLHEKHPILIDGKIKHVCKECSHDNDTPKNQEASKAP